MVHSEHTFQKTRSFYANLKYVFKGVIIFQMELNTSAQIPASMSQNTIQKQDMQHIVLKWCFPCFNYGRVISHLHAW